MKVGLVIYGELDTPTGGYLYDRRLVAHLREKGDEVEVVSLSRRSPESNLLDNLDPRLLRRLGGLDVDVLVQDELVHPSLCLLDRRLRRSVGFPLVSLVHHLSCMAERCAGKCGRYRTMEERFLSSMDGFIFNSQATRDSVVRAVPGASGVVAYPGKDHIRPVPPRERGSGPLTLIYIGNILPHKGLDVLVRALGRLPRGTVRLEVVGAALDRDFWDRTRRSVADLGLEEQVRFHGRLDDGERDALMDRCDLLAVPSFHEGYGLVYVEALAHGLPVIASASGGAAEMITDGRDGFLVGPGDELGLASRIRELSEDPATVREMSGNAVRTYGSLPSWGGEMEKARRFLRSMAV